MASRHPSLTALWATVLLFGVGCFVLPSKVSAWVSDDGSLEVHGFAENATFFRQEKGLSKFRNTVQLETTKRFGDVLWFQDVEVVSILRASYDGVYDLNDDHYGDDAGKSRNMESLAAPDGAWGASTITTGTLGFGFDLALNPNEGLDVLGQDLHNVHGGLAVGVPVRPCDKDDRGCLHEYMDADKDDLRFPEFADRLDFLRELYVRGSIGLANGDFIDISVGRQQVVWGRTDLFRVLDVINPVDFSRHNIYDELEDIRIPMGILTVEYRAGATGIFEDLNFQVLWKWEKFRPNNLGQAGTPYSVVDAGGAFRGFKTCWDVGCSVANFATYPGTMSTDFPANVVGIRDVNLPPWTIRDTDIGARLEGVVNSVGFSINVLYYYSQFPSLRGGVPARNPFIPTGAPAAAICQAIAGANECGMEYPNEFGGDLNVRSFLPAFDIEFPRIFMIGGSADIYADSIKSAIRIEVAYTDGEEFGDGTDPRLFSESDVTRWVIGLDRPTFWRWLNPRRSFLISTQIFGQHILDHNERSRPLGDVGMGDWENNVIMTMLIRGAYKQDRVSPQLIVAWDVRAQAMVFGPSVDWLISDRWRLIAGFNIKAGKGAHKYDDGRTANPFPPFTCATGVTPCTGPSMSDGHEGYQPTSRFRAGPIGMARQENEFQVTLRYRF